MAFMAAAIVLIGVISARGADVPSLLILSLDMVDTSGETPSHAQEHEDRLVALAQYLRRLWRTMGVTPSSIRRRSVLS